jgi:hypothetical protein
MRNDQVFRKSCVAYRNRSAKNRHEKYRSRRTEATKKAERTGMVRVDSPVARLLITNNHVLAPAPPARPYRPFWWERSNQLPAAAAAVERKMMNRLKKKKRKDPRIGHTKERWSRSLCQMECRFLRPSLIIPFLPLSVQVMKCCDPWRFDPIHSKLPIAY